ncbi:hypothetical protein CHISP_3279 [Chitinispirillum alkaliphilum]|nr:hypothetical protein CHISP_3279 [Chitinispirillum alkaliphilum]
MSQEINTGLTGHTMTRFFFDIPGKQGFPEGLRTDMNNKTKNKSGER